MALVKKALIVLVVVTLFFASLRVSLSYSPSNDLIGVYMDEQCTQKISDLNCKVYPNATTVLEIYVRNEGLRPFSLDLSASTNDQLDVSWSYPSSKISIGQVVAVQIFIRARNVTEPQSFSLVLTVKAKFGGDAVVVFSLNVDEEGYVVADVLLISSTSLTGGLGAYALNLSSSEGVLILDVSGGQAPFDAPPTLANLNGCTELAGTNFQEGGPQMTGLKVARLRLRLNSNATIEQILEPLNLIVQDAVSLEKLDLAVDEKIINFVRADANNDTHVTIADAMFIAQYLAGNRPASDLNLLNAASVKQDGAEGDKITIADAMFVAQYLAGLRDNGFNLTEHG